MFEGSAIRLLFGFGAVIAAFTMPVTPAISAECESQKTQAEGREFIKDGQSYSAVRKAAVQNAIAAAIEEVNPVGFSRISAGQNTSATNKDGDTKETQKFRDAYFRRIRGNTKSVKILREDVRKLGDFSLLSVVIEAEVCIEKEENRETVIAIGNMRWLDGSVSQTLRRDVFRSFPVIKNIIVIRERPGTAYSDISLSGKVDKISFRSLIKSRENRFIKFLRSGNADSGSVAFGQPLPRGSKEFMEIVVKVRVGARALASHRVLQATKVVVTEIPITNQPNWRRNRQFEAKKLTQFAFKLANRDIVERIKKSL